MADSDGHSAKDAGSQSTDLGSVNGRRGRKPGPHPRTVQLGRSVREQRDRGVTLEYLAAAEQSLDPTTARLTPSLLEQDLANRRKVMRRAETTAALADGLPPERRSTSPAVAHAHKRYLAHSAEHRELYLLNGGRIGLDAATLARPEFWESGATLLALRIELEDKMARVSGRKADTRGIEANMARHTAEAQRLRKLQGSQSDN